jgi:HD-GYP domain-containing protein (c-di-GMP phosphodiesterase class II)
MTLKYAQGVGFYSDSISGTELGLNEGLPRNAVLKKKLYSELNFAERLSSLPRAALLREEGFVVYHASPIVAKGTVIGVLEIFERKRVEHDQEWFTFLETLTGQIAIGIDSLGMFEDVQRHNLELIRSHEATIEGWSKALDLRDRETEGHTQRVTKVSVLLASKMGLTENEIICVRRGALLHDIGKMGVPDHILLKPGKLTEEEWLIMKKHPVYAYQLLLPIPFLSNALEIPHFHHERWDGTGYPQNLKGEDIPPAARLFAIVDVWDALRSDRPYRAGLSWEETKRAILEEEAGHFDPKVAKYFFELMNNGDLGFRTSVS